MAEASSSLPLNAQQQQQPQVPDNKRARPGDDSENTPNDVELREDMPQQKRQRRARGAKEKRLPGEVYEGEGAAANLSSSLNPPTDLNPAPQPQSGHSGWNQGIKGRLRTSFARPAVTAAAPKAAIVSFGQETDKTMADRAQNDGDGASTKDEVTTPPTETSAGKKEPSKRSRKRAKDKAKDAKPTKDAKKVKEAKASIWKADITMTFQGQTWLLPALWTAPEEDAKLKGRIHQTWDRRFVEWFEAFVALNPSPFFASKQAKAGGLGNLVQEAYSFWHSKSDWMSKNHVDESLQAMFRCKKKSEELAKIIADVQTRPPPTVRTQQLTGDGESPPTSAPGATSSTPADSNEREDGETDSDVSDSDPDMTEARDSSDFLEVERYFPGIAADVVFCTSCAGLGHRSDSCPEGTCRFCQDSRHLSSACPKRWRCSRCGQLGHNGSECREKLALAPGEDTECAFCQSRAHHEEDCTDFCRSYWPSEDSIHKVNNIPIYCYGCGTQGHYGTDCGLNRRRSIGIVTETWSKANWQRYVDINSAEDPISGPVWSEQDSPDRPDFGHGIAPQTHIYFEDSDDNDDNDFIRAQVQRPQQHRQIQIAPTRSQGGHSQGTYDYSQPRNDDFYPPLPPGPPPSHHTSGPGNLPARPPQPSGRPQRAHKPKPKNSQQQGGQKQGGQQNGQGSSRGGGGGRGGRGGGRGFSKLRGRGGKSGRN